MTIRNWFKNLMNLGDINIDIAKINYQKYQTKLERKQKKYIKTVCNKIKVASRAGRKFIETASLLNDFMTYDFMMELKEYFEQRGFQVKEKSNCSGFITSWLKISWK